MTTEPVDEQADAPRYAVIGNPVAHSLSPRIHAAFAHQTGRAIDYRRVLAPLDGFLAAVDRFAADGGRGFNVTVPFKREAFTACGSRVSDRARVAGAVNCVTVDASGLAGDNTDGIGLVDDLRRLARERLSPGSLRGCRLLLIGAGGAARGVIAPLLDTGLRALVVVARDPAKGAALVAEIARELATGSEEATLEARGFDALGDEPYDVIVNATSTGLTGAALPLPAAALAGARLAYDLMYGAEPTAFMARAAAAGCPAVDGLGMLVEQAAESFRLWHGIHPDTAAVRSALRASLRESKDAA